MLLFVVLGNEIIYNCCISNVIILTPDFLKIHEIVQNIGTQTRTNRAWRFHAPTSVLKEGKAGRNCSHSSVRYGIIDLTGPSLFSELHTMSCSKFVPKYVLLIKS
jgi:hypothetical protein